MYWPISRSSVGRRIGHYIGRVSVESPGGESVDISTYMSNGMSNDSRLSEISADLSVDIPL